MSFARAAGIMAFAALIAASTAALGQQIAISGLGHHTENRGWNDAGLGPMHQVIVTATVSPSGLPTLVFGERDGARLPLTHFPQPGTPDLYVLWQRYEPGPTGSWRILAERGVAKAAPVSTAPLAKPQEVPLVSDVRISGQGAQPVLHWTLPDLSGFDVERIRVGVRGGARLHGRFLSLLYASGDLPPTATSFRIPAGVLAKGERYVFQVMLEDLEGEDLENRSLTFSEVYSVPR
jgi:hypothetical protein